MTSPFSRRGGIKKEESMLELIMRGEEGGQNFTADVIYGRPSSNQEPDRKGFASFRLLADTHIPKALVCLNTGLGIYQDLERSIFHGQSVLSDLDSITSSNVLCSDHFT